MQAAHHVGSHQPAPHAQLEPHIILEPRSRPPTPHQVPHGPQRSLRGSELCKLNRNDVNRTATGFAGNIHKFKAKAGPGKWWCAPTSQAPPPTCSAAISQTNTFGQRRCSPIFKTTNVWQKRISASPSGPSYSGQVTRPALTPRIRSAPAEPLTCFVTSAAAVHQQMHCRRKSDTFQIYIRDNPDARQLSSRRPSQHAEAAALMPLPSRRIHGGNTIRQLGHPPECPLCGGYWLH